MPVRSIRNNSRSLYDRSAFSRTGESVVCDGAAAVLKDDAGTPPRLREIKQATGDFARSAVECDASSHRFSRLASPYSPQPGLRSRRWSSRSDAGFNPVAREMTSRAAADPNIMFYPFFRRRAQVEIDPRIRPGRFYRDGGTYFAGYNIMEYRKQPKLLDVLVHLLRSSSASASKSSSLLHRFNEA